MQAGKVWILVLCVSSIVTAPRGYLYCLKEFHTLVPENEINWVKFSGFYKHHKNKELDMY
jgi:hypothetical protein